MVLFDTADPLIQNKNQTQKWPHSPRGTWGPRTLRWSSSATLEAYTRNLVHRSTTLPAPRSHTLDAHIPRFSLGSVLRLWPPTKANARAESTECSLSVCVCCHPITSLSCLSVPLSLSLFLVVYLLMYHHYQYYCCCCSCYCCSSWTGCCAAQNIQQM